MKKHIYIGFDCTAPLLHMGHLIQIRMLEIIQSLKYNIIIIVGSITSAVGDPTGRLESRKLLTYNIIYRNRNIIKTFFYNIFDFQLYQKPYIIDNKFWLYQINYIIILEQFVNFLSLNRILKFCMIKSKISSANLLEFNYVLLQAYDYYYLNKHCNCMLQIGGNDQWNNILVGAQLIEQKNKSRIPCMTLSLMLDCYGRKISKSYCKSLSLCGLLDFYYFIIQKHHKMTTFLVFIYYFHINILCISSFYKNIFKNVILYSIIKMLYGNKVAKKMLGCYDRHGDILLNSIHIYSLLKVESILLETNKKNIKDAIKYNIIFSNRVVNISFLKYKKKKYNILYEN